MFEVISVTINENGKRFCNISPCEDHPFLHKTESFQMLPSAVKAYEIPTDDQNAEDQATDKHHDEFSKPLPDQSVTETQKSTTEVITTSTDSAIVDDHLW